MKESVMVRLEIGLIGFMMVFGIQCASAEKMRLTEKNGVVTITNKASEEARKSRVKKKAPKQASKAAMVRTESRSRNRYMLASEARHRFRMSGDKPSQLIEELGPLSGPRGALHHFKRRLAQTVNTGDEKPFTVVHYGDSHSQAGSFANALRQGLTPGPISPGYIHHKFPYSWNARTKKSTGWRRQNWLRNDIPPFGPLGIAFVTQASDETFKVILSDPNRPKGQTRVTLFYDYQPAHRAFSLEVGNRTVKRISPSDKPSTNPDGKTFLVSATHDPELAAAQVEVSETANEVVLRTHDSEDDTARLRVFGFLVQYEGAKLEWDVLAIGGTTIDSLMKRGDTAVEAYLGYRKPDLAMIWYGTNSLNNPRLKVVRYAKRYRAILDRLAKAAPDAACVVLGPTDFMKRDRDCFLDARQRRARRTKKRSKWKILRRRKRARVCSPDDLIDHRKSGRYRFPVPDVRTQDDWDRHKAACQYETRPLTEEMVAAQKDIAHRAGCLYFDTFSFMGGAGSIKKWACEEEPRLALLDLVHLTKTGYESLGKAVLQSIEEAGQREFSSR